LTAPTRPGWWWGLRAAASVTLAVVMLWLVLPRVTGTRWSQIGAVLDRLSVADLLVLTAVWMLGLWCYTFVLTASIPGLTHGQAITVNTTGSAVSNLIPFGGAVGLAVSLGIARSWGFRTSTFALSAVVTGVWNVLGKLLLPLLGLLGLLAAGDVTTGRLAGAAAIAAALLVLALGLLAGALSSERIAVGVGRAAQAGGRAVLRAVRSRRRLDWAHAVPRQRHQVIGLVQSGWLQMTLGLIGFLGAQACLLYVILQMLGSTLGPAQVFAGFAFGRLLTVLVITPGGVGIAETGAAGLLTALGGDAAICASAVLLFSGFVVFLEFPAGAAGYLVWLTRRSWRRAPGDELTPPTAG
jgi:uncharacterized membrane protein YbhN (UPF0104 family)